MDPSKRFDGGAVEMAIAVARRDTVARIERLVALGLAALTIPLFAVVYGPGPAIRYMIGLTLALIVQRVFTAALRERIGPEPSSAADVLTVQRAAVGALLAGLVF